jgi:apolipoprotein N-acyltransferase
VSGYTPGTTPSVVELNGRRFGILICFESAFPDYARSLTRLGSDVLFVLTQDGWWRGRFAAAQHFEMGRLRAAEAGRSVVQVSVDGYSGTIDADGSIRYRTGRLTRESAVIDVPVYHSTTLYSRYGYLAVRLLPGIWLAVIVLYGILEYRKTKT